MNLQNYSIGTRLSLGFLLIMLGLLFVSVVGYVELERVNADTQLVKQAVEEAQLAVITVKEVSQEYALCPWAVNLALLISVNTRTP